MYKLATFDPKKLEELNIPNQKEIIAMTGHRLIPLEVYELIKKETKNFTVANDLAKEADQKLLRVYERFSGNAPKQSELEMETTRIREQERARALALLELEIATAA